MSLNLCLELWLQVCDMLVYLRCSQSIESRTSADVRAHTGCVCVCIGGDFLDLGSYKVWDQVIDGEPVVQILDVTICELYMWSSVIISHHLRLFQAIGNRDSIPGSDHKPVNIVSTLMHEAFLFGFHLRKRQGPTSPRPANA